MKHHFKLRLSLGALQLQAQAEFSHDLIVLSGDNGSGKTSLLRCLAGLEDQLEGQWVLHSHQPTVQRNIGCVWTNAALLPWLNVLQNIQLGRTAAQKQHSMPLCKTLHIHHLLTRHPAMLSTGEAQRVSLARAILMQPQLLLLDEPFSAQAPHMRQHLRVWLKQQHERWNIPIIMVSHDHQDVQVLADQRWHMYEGQLDVKHSIDKVKYESLNPF